MLTFSNNVEPANGFLVRYLRRKLVESDSDVNANREELLRVLDWVPKLWYHLHTFLEKHSTSDFLIGTAGLSRSATYRPLPSGSSALRAAQQRHRFPSAVSTAARASHPELRKLAPPSLVPDSGTEEGARGTSELAPLPHPIQGTPHHLPHLNVPDPMVVGALCLLWGVTEAVLSRLHGLMPFRRPLLLPVLSHWH